MSLSTRLAERGVTVNGRTPHDVLAAEATRLAQEARDLGRAVADTTDVPACLPATEAAVRLEGLADVLTGPNESGIRGRRSRRRHTGPVGSNHALGEDYRGNSFRHDRGGEVPGHPPQRAPGVANIGKDVDMGDTTPTATVEELQAQVARLEYQLQLVHLKDYSVAPDAMRVQGEADAIVNELPLVDAVHFPDDFDPEAEAKPYAALCVCGYTVRTETLEDAQALVRPHEREVHSEFLTHWPHLSGEASA